MFTLSYTPINLHRYCQANSPEKARKARQTLDTFGEPKEATNRHFKRRFQALSAFLCPSFSSISTFCSPAEKKQLKSENSPEHISVWFCYEIFYSESGPAWMHLQLFDSGLLLFYFREDGLESRVIAFLINAKQHHHEVLRQWRTIDVCTLPQPPTLVPALTEFFRHKISSIKLTNES